MGFRGEWKKEEGREREEERWKSLAIVMNRTKIFTLQEYEPKMKHIHLSLTFMKSKTIWLKKNQTETYIHRPSLIIFMYISFKKISDNNTILRQ